MRRRIVLFAATTALFAVTLLAVPLGVVAARGYVRDERLELQQAAASAAAHAHGDVTSAAVTVSDREVRVTVYDRAGRRLSGSGPTSAPKLVRGALTGQERSSVGARIAVAAPVSDGDQVVAALLVTTSLDSARSKMWRAWWLLAGMCLAAVLVVASAAALLARRLTRPLDRLTILAADLGADPSQPLAGRSGIAEIDALAEVLERSAQRVQDSLARERAVSAELSHQLRTPVASLRLDLEAALASRSAREHITRSLRAVERLDETIADVVRLARDTPSGEHVRVSLLLSTAVDRWRGILADAGRPLRVRVDDDTPDEFALSRAAATQILDVLLDNALRHGEGAVLLHVVRLDDAAVAVEVSDEGPPLAVEAWQLFRTVAQREDAAHGLGLPFARRLAERESARLVVARDSPPTFRLIAAVGSASRT